MIGMAGRALALGGCPAQAACCVLLLLALWPILACYPVGLGIRVVVDVRFKSYFLGRLSAGPRQAQVFQDETQSPLCSDPAARRRLGLTAPALCRRRADLTRLCVSALKPAVSMF